MTLDPGATRRRSLTALAAGAVLFGAFAFVVWDQLARPPAAVRCWFYDERWGERSPSEVLSLALWLALGAIAARRAFRSAPASRERRLHVLLAAFAAALFLEESNYGRTVLLLVAGPSAGEGSSLHNRIEGRFQEAYWTAEAVLRQLVFAAAFLSPFVLLARRRPRDPLLGLAAAAPAAAWLFFAWYYLAWERLHGVPPYPHHPCVSIDEEVLETLLPAGLLFLLLVLPRGAPRSAG